MAVGKGVAVAGWSGMAVGSGSSGIAVGSGSSGIAVGCGAEVAVGVGSSSPPQATAVNKTRSKGMAMIKLGQNHRFLMASPISRICSVPKRRTPPIRVGYAV